MKVTLLEIVKYLKLLEETPRRILALSKGIDETLLQFKSDGKRWSANDILAHLRSCADVWSDSIYRMLTEENPTVPDHHPRQWIKKTSYPTLPFHESFQAFAAQRKKLLTVMKKLSFEDWSRSALIGERRHTVFSQARRTAKHEQEHCGQIESLLK